MAYSGVSDQEGKMTDGYKAFVREMRRRMIEMNLTPQTAAEFVGVGKSTFYKWINMKTVMSGDDMIRIIDTMMFGKYEKLRTLP